MATCLALRFTQTILFLGSCVVFFLIRTTGVRRDVIEQQSPIGLTTRRHLVSVWCVAHFVRGACAGAEVFACSGLVGPGVWNRQLMRCLGDLPFWSAYSLFVLFMGHLHQTAALGTSPRLFPLWTVVNVFMYTVAILLSIFSMASYSQSGTRDIAGEMVQYLIGAGYITLLGLLIHHSWLLHQTIQPSIILVPSELLQVLTRLTSFVAFLLLVQATYFILTATKLPSSSHVHYGCKSVCLADFASSAGLELMPSYLAMFHLRAFKHELFGFHSTGARPERGIASFPSSVSVSYRCSSLQVCAEGLYADVQTPLAQAARKLHLSWHSRYNPRDTRT
mmetsp:Transcript_13188/g.42980  ORF Transcript_13188/g.42980 Transcript_13188/m.42980 type:complete len:335 (-) Transcript_13188:119-1123(-)